MADKHEMVGGSPPQQAKLVGRAAIQTELALAHVFDQRMQGILRALAHLHHMQLALMLMAQENFQRPVHLQEPIGKRRTPFDHLLDGPAQPNLVHRPLQPESHAPVRAVLAHLVDRPLALRRLKRLELHQALPLNVQFESRAEYREAYFPARTSLPCPTNRRTGNLRD